MAGAPKPAAAGWWTSLTRPTASEHRMPRRVKCSTLRHKARRAAALSRRTSRSTSTSRHERAAAHQQRRPPVLDAGAVARRRHRQRRARPSHQPRRRQHRGHTAPADGGRARPRPRPRARRRGRGGAWVSLPEPPPGSDPPRSDPPRSDPPGGQSVTEDRLLGGRVRLRQPAHGARVATRKGVAELGERVSLALVTLSSKGAVPLIHRAGGIVALLGPLAGRAGGVVICPLWPRAAQPASRVLVQARKQYADAAGAAS